MLKIFKIKKGEKILKLKNNVSPRQFWVKLLILATLIAVVFMVNPLKPAQAATSSTWQNRYVGNISSSYEPRDTAIATDSNGYLYTAVTLHNSLDYNTMYLYVYRSVNHGASWTFWREVVSWDTYTIESADIAVDLYNNDVYVAYELHSPIAPNYYSYIRCARLLQSGETYKYTVEYAYYPNFLFHPSIAIQWPWGASTGNYIYVAYENYHSSTTTSIEVKKSMDHGDSWTDWETDYLHYTGYQYWYPDLAIDVKYNSLYVAFQGHFPSGSYTIGVMWGSCTWSDTTAKYYSLLQSSSSTLGYPTIAISRSTSSSSVAVAYGSFYSGGTGYYNLYLRYATTVGHSGSYPSWSFVSIDSYSNRNTLRPRLAVDGMETTGSYLGNFWIVYYEYNEGGTAYKAYVVKKASYSNLGSWSEYHRSTSIYPFGDHPRVFGLTTFIKGHGGYAPAISYIRSNEYFYTAGDFITMPPTLSLYAPEAGSITGDYTPYMDWSDVSGMSYYRVIVRKGSQIGTTVVDFTTTSSYISNLPSLLSHGSDDYWWYVTAYDSGGDTRTSSWSYFWLDVTPPGIPTLTDPVSGTYTNDNTPTLYWDAPILSPTLYQVYYYRSGYSAVKVTTVNTYYTMPVLPDGTWNWRVQARDAYGNWGTYSSYNYFYVDTVAPAAPGLVHPLDNDDFVDHSTPIVLDWNGVSGCNYYNLQVDDSSSFDSLNINYYTSGTSSKYVFPNGVWYWRVRARDYALNWGPTSSERYFTVTSTGPSLITPEDETFINDDTPYFDWNSVSGATDYNIQVDNSSGSTVINANTGSNSYYQSLTALPQGTYNWSVRSFTSPSWSQFTSSWNFTVDITDPNTPSLTFPVDRDYAAVQTLNLDWEPITDAVLYQVQVDDTSVSMTSLVHNYTTTDSNYTITFSDGTYYWHARAQDAAGNWGLWSTVWNFTVDTTAPGVPSLVSPTDGSFVVIDTPLLNWTDITDATEYQVQMDDENTFNTPVRDITSITNETTLTTLGDETYYWQVRAIDAAGNYGQWSMNKSFTVDTKAPLVPTLNAPGSAIYPPSEVVITENTPKFEWNVLSDAVLYRLQVDNNSDFSSPELYMTTTDNVLWTLPDDTYYWRVWAKDAAGNWGPYSTVWCVTIDTTGPTAPSLTSPADSSTVVTDTPQLNWGVVSDASEYQVQVDNDPDFSSPELDINIDTNPYTTSSLSDGTYYWRVRGNDSVGNSGPWSTEWSFTIDTIGAAAPSLTSPTDGALLTVNTPQLTWGTVAGANAYQVQVDDASSFNSLNFEYTTPSTTHATTTLVDGTYYWRVRSDDTVGNWGDWSDVWSFTIDTTAPGIPTLSSPANGASVGYSTPLLEWNAVGDATEYQVQVAGTSAFTTPAFNQTTAGLSFDVPVPLGDGMYYWRVSARDEAGNWGSWSDVWDFIVDATPPPAPTTPSPANGASVDYTPQLGWNAAAGASEYHVQVATSDTFTTTFVDTTRDKLFVIIPLTLGDGTYYWQVRAVDDAGNWGDWSAAWNFIVDTSALTGPSPPSYISPTDGSDTADTTPTLEWNVAAAAAKYNVQVGDDVNGFTSPVVNEDTTDTNHTTTALSPGFYYWRVRTADSGDNWGTWGAVWSFTVPIPVPTAPTLISPADASSTADTTPTLDWDDVQFAEEYWVQIASSYTFTTIVQSANTTESEYTATILTSATYYWRVKAVNKEDVWSDWSDPIWSFTISVALLGPPTLTAPADASSFTDTTPMLTWDAVTSAAKYNVQIDADKAFPSPDQTSESTNNYYTATILAPGTYYWRVRTANSEGLWSAWSDVWSFTIEVESITTAETTTAEETTTTSESTAPPPGVSGSGFEFIGIVGLLLLSVVTIRKRRKR